MSIPALTDLTKNSCSAAMIASWAWHSHHCFTVSDPKLDVINESTDLPLVLFLCTGNYYRSRFAEAVFNHHAQQMAVAWRAFSRGLAIHLASGDLSPYTERALADRGIDRSLTSPTRHSLCEVDLRRAYRVVVLDEFEHRPLVHKLFPAWEKLVTYWSVPDIDRTKPERALPEIERLVLERLLTPLAAMAASRGILESLAYRYSGTLS